MRKKIDAAIAVLSNDAIEHLAGYALMMVMFRRGGPRDPSMRIHDPQKSNFGHAPGMADCLFGDLPGDMMKLVESADADGFVTRKRLLQLRQERLTALGVPDDTNISGL